MLRQSLFWSFRALSKHAALQCPQLFLLTLLGIILLFFKEWVVRVMSCLLLAIDMSFFLWLVCPVLVAIRTRCDTSTHVLFSGGAFHEIM